MSEGVIPTNERINAAEVNLERQLDWITRYDYKSSALLGLDTAMVGALALTIHGLGSTPLESVMTDFALLGLGGAFLLLFVGATPQLKSRAESLLFFGTIAKRTLHDYKQAFRNQTPQEYLDDLLEQCHRNSEILSVKFRYVGPAFYLIVLAIIPWTLALVLA